MYTWKTEAQLTKSRADGPLDFAVYGPDGDLTDRSTFLAGRDEWDLTQQVPHQCMVCHCEAWPDNIIISLDPLMGYTVLNLTVTNIVDKPSLYTRIRADAHQTTGT